MQPDCRTVGNRQYEGCQRRDQLRGGAAFPLALHCLIRSRVAGIRHGADELRRSPGVFRPRRRLCDRGPAAEYEDLPRRRRQGLPRALLLDFPQIAGNARAAGALRRYRNMGVPPPAGGTAISTVDMLTYIDQTLDKGKAFAQWLQKLGPRRTHPPAPCSSPIRPSLAFPRRNTRRPP